jgi:hypothetical protein
MPKVSVHVSQSVSWGGSLSPSIVGYSRAETPWIRGEAEQDGTLVWAQYVRPGQVLTVGPTPAADESAPADGRVALGYWSKNGTFREVASSDFNITA